MYSYSIVLEMKLFIICNKCNYYNLSNNADNLIRAV